MSVDPTKIHQGPGNLWLNVSVPTTGNRMLINASGVPTEGSPVDAGAIEGAITLALGAKMDTIDADQLGGPVDAVMTGETDSIEVTMKESDLAKLRYFLQHGTYSTGTDAGLPGGAQAYEEIAFGGIMPIPKMSVAAISRRRDSTTKHVVSQLYSAIQMEAIALPYSRDKSTTFKVKFVGLNIPTRPVGDQCGKIFRQI